MLGQEGPVKREGSGRTSVNCLKVNQQGEVRDWTRRSQLGQTSYGWYSFQWVEVLAEPVFNAL